MMKLKPAILAVAASAIMYGPQAVAQMPEVRSAGPVNYVSGGVGEAEIAAMKQAAMKYPLELVFVQNAVPRDQYLAGVGVRIENSRGQVVLETVADGPFLLAQLPAGRYTVSARLEDIVKRRDLALSSGQHRRVVFEWQ